MPRVRATDQDLERFAGEIARNDRKLTILALREAAGGGSHARLSRFVDGWNRRHRSETAGKPRTGRGTQAAPQAGASPTRRRTRAAREPEPAIEEVIETQPGSPEDIAELTAGELVRRLDLGPPASGEPGEVMAAPAQAGSPDRGSDAAEVQCVARVMPVSDAAGVEAAALTARLDALARENERAGTGMGPAECRCLDALARENERLWAILREERASRNREVETLNRLVEQQNRLLDNASRMLERATHQARGEIDLLRQQFEAAAARLSQPGGNGGTASGL